MSTVMPKPVPLDDVFGSEFKQKAKQNVKNKISTYLYLRTTWKKKIIVFTCYSRRNLWYYIQDADVRIAELIPVPQNYVKTYPGYRSYMDALKVIILDTIKLLAKDDDKELTCTICDTGTVGYPQINLIISAGIPTILNEKRPDDEFEFGEKNVMIEGGENDRFKVLYLPKLQKHPAFHCIKEASQEESSGASQEESTDEDSTEDAKKGNGQQARSHEASTKDPTEDAKEGNGQQAPSHEGSPKKDLTEAEKEELLSPEEFGWFSSMILKFLKATGDERRKNLPLNVSETGLLTVETGEEGYIAASMAKLLSPRKSKKDEGEKSVEPDDVSGAESSTTPTSSSLLSVAVGGIVKLLSPTKDDVSQTRSSIAEQSDSSMLSPEDVAPPDDVSGAESSTTPASPSLLSAAVGGIVKLLSPTMSRKDLFSQPGDVSEARPSTAEQSDSSMLSPEDEAPPGCMALLRESLSPVIAKRAKREDDQHQDK